MGYRFKVILLSLGVVFGFGSAFAHFSHWHGYRHDHCAWQDADHGQDHGQPAKPVQ